MAFQKGNQLAAKHRWFDDALRKEIVQDNYKKIREAARKLLECAAKGEAWAIKELADRTDGKAAQTMEVIDNREPRDMSINEILALIAAERAADKEAGEGESSAVH